MSLDRTKADVELNGQAFQITSLTKDSAPALVPQFNTGAQGDTDLQLVKSVSNTNFEGGGLQEEWIDDQQFSVVRNSFYEPTSGRLFPSPAKTEVATYASSDASNYTYFNTASCYYNDELYIAYRYYSSGAWKTGIKKVSDDSDLTIPTDLRDQQGIFDMVVYKGVMVISGDSSYSGWKWDGTTFTQITAIPGSTRGMCVMNGTLYFIRANDEFWKNTDITASSTAIGSVGVSGGSVLADARILAYQNRVYILHPEGLFVFDGVQIYKAIDEVFITGAVYRGWLYLTDGKKIYRFNGITYEMLKDFTSIGTIDASFVANSDRIYFNVTLSKVVEEVQGGTGQSASSGSCALYYYDSVGFFEYEAYTLTNQTSSGVVGYDKPYLVTASTAESTDASVYEWDTTDEQDLTATMNQLDVISSIHDGGFPNVPKTLHYIKVVLSSIGEYGGTLQYRLRDSEGAWDSSWTSAGTVSGASSQQIYLDTPVEYNAVQVRFLGGANDTVVKRVAFGYTIHPDRRNRWQVTLLCQGQDKYFAQEENDGTELTVDPITLREAVYASAQSKLPVDFVEVDYTRCNGAHTNSVTTITVDSTEMFPENGTIRIGTEQIKYTGKTATTFTGCTRGAWGTTASTHSDNDVVEPLYRVYLKRIINERYILDENTKNVNSGTTNPGLESEIAIELEEV